ncbi:MAG: hypothetical protein DDT32_01315 [Syntrophomonadaceae bacterium]|nr:hypothetical protein [Bacillota bacterium]MBT9147556.1 hypothetical protein [Bacillota bacterium]
MTENPEFALLVDIAKLLKKYGPDTFESLAKAISSPQFSEQLTSILVNTATIGRPLQEKKGYRNRPNTTQRDFRSSLVSLSQTEPEKAKLLISFYDGVGAKTLLPTLRDLQSFASDAGLPPLKATSRIKAIMPLTRALIPMDVQELSALLSSIRSVSPSDDRSLEGWTNIILKSDRDEHRHI